MISVYLAGPEVFLTDAREIGARKVALCAEFGLQGLYPLDAELDLAGDPHRSMALYRANVALMGKSDAVIANLTPFRGVSADAGTVFEVGYALAKGMPVFAYSNDARSFAERVGAAVGTTERRDFLGRVVASDGIAIEAFEQAPVQFDNLMLVDALRAQGWDIISRDVPAPGRLTDLNAFRDCLALARSWLPAKRDGLAA